MSETPKQPKPAENPDTTDTAVQPAAPDPAEPPAAAPQPDAPYAAEPPAAGPKKSRLAWVSSPKVAAATVITVLALSGLGGAFALGRATAPDHDDRMVVRVPAGFEGQRGFEGPRGFELREGGPGMRQRFGEGELDQAPVPEGNGGNGGEVTPAPSQSS